MKNMQSISASNLIIVFDFDGTLADTLDETIKIFNELSDEFGCRKVDFKDKKFWRDRKRVV